MGPTHGVKNNRYAQEHQEEIRALLERRYPTLDTETKHYILTARFVDLPGLDYTSGNPNQEDKAFEQKVRSIFEDSGMNAYIAAYNPSSSPIPSHE